ncbi:hypothetical protein AVEN_135256-1 [Araneus ventricosus]|uniref:Uncharacterized protein n=1 Tax=Araneus ventricosus TaxID=182803 RepID=A0A4Y2CPQ0_ARAVE|nr:hypothetical protein AVEN_135256-1 [Araneus ventricosus]
MANCEQPTSRAVSMILVPSLRTIMVCSLSNSLRSAVFPITRKSKCKNYYLPSPAAVKYHSHLTMCPPRHPDKFIEKCVDGHNVLACQCISWKKITTICKTGSLQKHLRSVLLCQFPVR